MLYIDRQTGTRIPKSLPGRVPASRDKLMAREKEDVCNNVILVKHFGEEITQNN